MFYFKTITIPDTAPELIERAIRSCTVKRSSYLDFLITASEDHGNKIFSGIERENVFLLTRMRDESDSSMRFRRRTKVFIRFRKDKGFASYQMRFGFKSSLFFCFLLLATLFSILHAFNGGSTFWFMILLQVVDVLVATMAYVEIDLNQDLIDKAIERSRTATA